ncbi:TY-Chap domain-containing protein [Gordonia aurantiaca]|uniref:TY-Chap domain-containing protein n=1 Tax=Gordonia sp. B21 TaxID=3151852 RepID=UPI003267AFF2
MSPDFDAVVEAAWRDFTDTLAARALRLAPGQTLTVMEAAAGGWRRRMTFAVAGPGRLRCTISAGDLTWTDKDRWMRQATHIIDRGWCRLEGRSSFCYEVDARVHVDLARAAVRALREVWGVIHPSFVSIGDPSYARHQLIPNADLETTGPLDTGAVAHEGSPGAHALDPRTDPDAQTNADTIRFAPLPRPLDAPVDDGVAPRSVEHLVELVRAAMAAAGRPIVISPRNAIFLRSSVTTLMRPARDAKALEIVTILSSTVPPPSVLGLLVTEFSPRWPEISVVVKNGLVYAQRRIDVAVFSPANLEVALRRWDEFTRTARGEMIARLEGRHSPLRCRGERLPAVLRALVRAKQKRPGSTLSPNTVLVACQRDPARVHEYFDICATEMREWMNNLESARKAELGEEEIAFCMAEHRAYAEIAQLLLSAMELT